MKAAVITGFTQPLEIKQVEIPKPKNKEILVKNIACGVCHSDLHITKGDWDEKCSLPRIPGHEGIGEIIELGSQVDNHLQIRDIVGIPWTYSTCLKCEYCLSGQEALCEQLMGTGFSYDGCLAEYTLMDSDFVVKLPDGMDPYTSAPLFCAGVTVYKALKMSGVPPNEWVSIVGVGGLGSVAIKYAVAMGMKVLAVVAPNDQNAVNLSKEMGASEVYDGPSDQHSQWVQDKLRGVQAAIVTVPLIQAYDEAYKSVKRGGRIVAVGLPNGTMSIPIIDCVCRGIQLIGSMVGSREDLKEALAMAKAHKISCKIQKRKLEDINQVFEDMINYRINGRVVIDFTLK
ncbi:unnamed protein product [Adineta ricciae]|uniref:Enoyl reductase (ER) domain-containing protein n=1 Tax=Adineta ricciae TaxID=249248 RepID=A0A815T6H3_ADIRI|nr:unnamed protein product [Adineta ricciae]CAF1531049.1 unnamed protein product [Adineta ricciae]